MELWRGIYLDIIGFSQQIWWYTGYYTMGWGYNHYNHGIYQKNRISWNIPQQTWGWWWWWVLTMSRSNTYQIRGSRGWILAERKCFQRTKEKWKRNQWWPYLSESPHPVVWSKKTNGYSNGLQSTGICPMKSLSPFVKHPLMIAYILRLLILRIVVYGLVYCKKLMNHLTCGDSHS